jgi:hypothetical protein
MRLDLNIWQDRSAAILDLPAGSRRHRAKGSFWRRAGVGKQLLATAFSLGIQGGTRPYGAFRMSGGLYPGLDLLFQLRRIRKEMEAANLSCGIQPNHLSVSGNLAAVANRDCEAHLLLCYGSDGLKAAPVFGEIEQNAGIVGLQLGIEESADSLPDRLALFLLHGVRGLGFRALGQLGSEDHRIRL